VYPGLMVTSGAIHWVMNALAMPMDIRNICVFLAPLFRWVIEWLMDGLIDSFVDEEKHVLIE
jgi:hypothetical protein